MLDSLVDRPVRTRTLGITEYGQDPTLSRGWSREHMGANIMLKRGDKGLIVHTQLGPQRVRYHRPCQYQCILSG